MNIEFMKPEIISLKRHPEISEKLIQDEIEKDPSILGLEGDLRVSQRERKQSSGGRIDLLIVDDESGTMYETEIMLGSLDESHIIRAIEYWDVEKRRFPSKDHVAVIVAEEITSRFFNVISLLNATRAIPLIAIKLHAAKQGDKIVLNFIRVMDAYEESEGEDVEVEEITTRAYWESRANRKSMSVFDGAIKDIQGMGFNPRVTYNKGHIAVGTNRRNFLWFHPKKKETYCHFDIRVGEVNVDRVRNLFASTEMYFSKKKRSDQFASQLKLDSPEQSEPVKEIFKLAWTAYE